MEQNRSHDLRGHPAFPWQREPPFAKHSLGRSVYWAVLDHVHLWIVGSLMACNKYSGKWNLFDV